MLEMGMTGQKQRKHSTKKKKESASEDTKEYSIPEERHRRWIGRYWGSRRAVDDQMKVLTTFWREEKRTSEQRIVHGLITSDSNPGSESGGTKKGLLWAAR